jgi:[ribosomal protein S5]-alanine N-acetyltransferase
MTQNDGDARVRLRPLVPDDQDEFIAEARASTGLHHPWYTMPTTPEAFQAYLVKYSQPTAEGWLVCLRDGGALAGGLDRPGTLPAGQPGLATAGRPAGVP